MNPKIKTSTKVTVRHGNCISAKFDDDQDFEEISDQEYSLIIQTYSLESSKHGVQRSYEWYVKP